MPAKPVKHGVKVFCLCCAYTGVLYGFEFFTGQETNLNGSPTEIVKRLIYSCGAACNGRIVYTDNYYTSIQLEIQLYILFKMFLVGTFRLTQKIARTAN